MRPGVHVDVVRGLRERDRPGRGRDHLGRLEERRGGRRGGELRAELAERRVLRLRADEARGRDVPERRGAAVAQHDLVAVGQREQRGQALARAAHQGPDGRLPVGRPQQGGPGVGQRPDLRGADLGRPGPEAAVGRQEVRGIVIGVFARSGTASPYARATRPGSLVHRPRRPRGPGGSARRCGRRRTTGAPDGTPAGSRARHRLTPAARRCGQAPRGCDDRAPRADERLGA